MPNLLPENRFLRQSMQMSCTIGLWPFIFKQSPKLERFFQIYAYFAYIYLALFIITALIQCNVMLQSDNPLNLTDLFDNLGATLLYIIQIIRSFTLKTKRLQGMIGKIFKTESKIMQSHNKDIISIYSGYVTYSRRACSIFMSSAFVVNMLFLGRSFLGEPVENFDLVRNETVYVKRLPLSATWLPFDSQTHFAYAALFNTIAMFIGTFFVISGDIMTFTFVIYPISQLRILNYVISYFEEFCGKVQKDCGFEEETAVRVTFRECIYLHKEVISYIQDFNANFSTVMLLDFFQASLQLATLVLQLMLGLNSAVEYAGIGFFTAAMLLRLYLYYWNGNEIMVQSEAIALSVWQSTWYTQSEQTKQEMNFMIMRAQKNLQIYIGPFNTMSVQTLLAILKATYSYMMLIYRQK